MRFKWEFLLIILVAFACQSKRILKNKASVSERPIDPLAQEAWSYQSKLAWAPPARLDRGFKLCSQKKALQAIREWQQKLQLHKQDKTYWYALGNCYALAQQDALSIYAFKVGLGSYPNDTQMKHNLALMYMRRKDYQKSFPLLLEVVKASQNSLLPQFHLGQLYYLFANYAEAKTIFQRLETALPDQVDVKKWIAQSSYFVKDYTNAVRYFSLLPNYTQKDMETANYYAHALYETGKIDLALEVISGNKSNQRLDLVEF